MVSPMSIHANRPEQFMGHAEDEPPERLVIRDDPDLAEEASFLDWMAPLIPRASQAAVVALRAMLLQRGLVLPE